MSTTWHRVRCGLRELCKSRGFTALAVLTLALACLAEAQAPPANRRGEPEESLVLRLIDPEGQPVPRAKVGTALNIFVTSEDRPPTMMTIWVKGTRRTWPSRSDAEGKVLLTGTEASYREYFAWHEGRGLVGFADIPRERQGREVELRLQPACHVYGEITSKGFADTGCPITKSTARLNRRGTSRTDFYMVSEQNNFEFYLPCGDYHLVFYATGVNGRSTEKRSLECTVKSGQRELDLGTTDLPPEPSSWLFGKPAPALVGIKEWKNSKPLRLSDLRGKVVVLDFWGHWCGPCLGGMPELMELHDRFGNRGCVIIAVHDSSLSSIEEVDKHLEKVRKGRWKGRELPFAVALDSAEPVQGPPDTSDPEYRGHGATHTTYAITKWPTTLLIDRDGVLVGEFRGLELQKQVERMLASPTTEPLK